MLRTIVAEPALDRQAETGVGAQGPAIEQSPPMGAFSRTLWPFREDRPFGEDSMRYNRPISSARRTADRRLVTLSLP